MRRRFRAAAWLAVWAAVLLLVPAALRADRTYFHRGTATIDGIEGPGEWTGAVAGTAPVTLPSELGGGTFDVDFLVMSDDVHLYVGARLAYGISPPSGELLGLVAVTYLAGLDPCLPSTVTDDHELVSSAEQQLYGDFFRDIQADCQHWILEDSAAGGSTEGSGVWEADGATTFFEIAQPLDTEDDSHDLSAAPRSRVELQLLAGGCATGGCGELGVLQRRVFLAPANLVFLGDYEAGDATDWSFVTP